MKVVGKSLLFLLLFFGLWAGFSALDLMTFFNVRSRIEATEKKTGDLIMKIIRSDKKEVCDSATTSSLLKIRNAICLPNYIDTTNLQIHLINSSDVNAFALPGGQIIVYTGLVDFCRNEDELCSVIAHELVHIQHRHVAKKMTKEFTIMLAEASSGNAGSQIAASVLKQLTSTAYDRKLESDADISSVYYMKKSRLDPAALAKVLYRFSEKDEAPGMAYWITDHPESKSRADAIMEIADRNSSPKKILTDSEWQSLKGVAGKMTDEEKGLRVFSWCIMTNHVHMIIGNNADH